MSLWTDLDAGGRALLIARLADNGFETFTAPDLDSPISPLIVSADGNVFTLDDGALSIFATDPDSAIGHGSPGSRRVRRTSVSGAPIIEITDPRGLTEGEGIGLVAAFAAVVAAVVIFANLD